MAYDNNQQDTVRQIFRKAGKIEILSAEREQLLVHRINLGLSDSDGARDELVNAHLSLVVKIARKFLYTGIPLDDLVQQGNIGLLEAIPGFEIERGFRFSTYAQWWVRQSINSHVGDNGGACRIPRSRRDQIHALNRAIAELSRNGKIPTDTEIAHKMEFAVATVRELMADAQHPVSTNMLVFKGHGSSETELGDLLVDERAPSPEQSVITTGLNEAVEQALAILDDRLRQITIMRHDLDGKGIRTLEEIGKIYNITKERVRQLENEALRKLAGGKAGKALKTYLQTS